MKMVVTDNLKYSTQSGCGSQKEKYLCWAIPESCFGVYHFYKGHHEWGQYEIGIIHADGQFGQSTYKTE